MSSILWKIFINHAGKLKNFPPKGEMLACTLKRRGEALSVVQGLYGDTRMLCDQRRFQVEGASRIIMGKISRRPKSMATDKTNLEK